MADIHLLGIRHHGPGSCRNVLQALERIRPDLILLEGPAEAEALMPFVADSRMRPPVALLGYQPDAPQNAVFYPFAEFSPEWQVLCYAMREKVILRFFDLPLAHSLAVFTTQTDEQDPERTPLPSHDPFDLLAEAAGYTDGETWWNMNIEQRRDNKDIFEAVKEAVSALREAQPEYTSRRDLIREAWMRRMIRAAQKEPFERIAVVCGAWHVPALENMPKVKEDNEQLKGLSKVKIECTWIPWTYDRLMFRSGYGAGITSPGWYDYLWSHPEDDGTLWVSRIAALLREKGMDISVAHVIETVRLAQATAALRGMPTPTLEEYNEAVTTVMGFGDDTLLQLVKENLVVSNRLGQVPDEVPKVPLLIDVERHQKRLRVPFTAEIKELTLDLRKENDLGRSLFFHRLALLDIDWAKPVTVKGKGTFKERWSLYHRPEQIVRIIEQAIWGNTLEEASQKYITHLMTEIEHIPELTRLLSRVIPANLPGLVDLMTRRLDRLSAASSDIVEMMEAVPDLVNIVRYGDVRGLDFSQVGNMLQAMIARILAGGLLVCVNIDEEAAANLLDKLVATDYAVNTLNDDELNTMWYEFINQIRCAANAHPLLSGYATRLLYDKGKVSQDETQTTLSFYSSVGNAPSDMAYWFEGFLHASGSVLLLNDNLWLLVNSWICGLQEESFRELLPILRRTFSDFSSAERRKLGEKAKRFETNGDSIRHAQDETMDDQEAAKVIPLLSNLLGIE